MRSLVFVIATLLVALLTAVRSEMNSSSVDDGNLHRDGRVTVDFGASADSPMTIKSGSDGKNSSSDGVTVKFRSVQEDPSTFPKPEEPPTQSNVTRPKRYCVGTVDAKNTAIFKKRGIVNINSTDEEPSETSNLPRTERECENIYGTKNLAVLKKRGNDNSNSAAESQPVLDETQQPSEASDLTRSDRAYVGTINSEKTVVFKKRGSVGDTSMAEPEMRERAVIGNFNSQHTDSFNQGGPVNINPTPAPQPALNEINKLSEAVNLARGARAYVGTINSEKTVVFKKRGSVGDTSMAEPEMRERAVIGTFNSQHTDHFNFGEPVHINSTAEQSPVLSEIKKLSEVSNLTRSERAYVGTINSEKTVVFKKRGANPPSNDMGKTGQLSEHVGSVNGSLSA